MLLPPGTPPATKMSSKRAKAKTTKKRPQRATSNVFAMFDQSQIQEFKEAFNMIDQNRDGFIDKEDLHDMLASLGEDTLPPLPPAPPREWGELQGDFVPATSTGHWLHWDASKPGGDFSAPPPDRRGLCEVSEGSSSVLLAGALARREETLGAGEALPWKQPPAATMECFNSLTPECLWGRPSIALSWGGKG